MTFKRKTAKCIECQKETIIYSSKRCQYCYWRSKPKKPIQKKAYVIPKRSKKGQKEDRTYSKESKKYKESNPYCLAKLNGCTIYTSDVHHQKGRGILLNEQKYWLPVCRNCHNQITEHSALAIEQGLSFSRLLNNE